MVAGDHGVARLGGEVFPWCLENGAVNREVFGLCHFVASGVALAPQPRFASPVFSPVCGPVAHVASGGCGMVLRV